MVISHFPFNTFLGPVKAYEKVWIIGCDFVANTYNQYVQDAVRKRELYMKNHCDVEVFATKSCASLIRSCIGHLLNEFLKALNAQSLLPCAIITVLDDDFLRYIKYDEDDSLSRTLTEVFEWLCTQIERAINTRKEQLPEKSMKYGYPSVYFVEAPQHINFRNNSDRRKMNSAMQNVTSLHQFMKIIRMKQAWDADDRKLYNEMGRFTSPGLFKYWESVDSSFEYNDRLAENHINNTKFNEIYRNRTWSRFGKKQDFKAKITKSRFKLPNPDNY